MTSQPAKILLVDDEPSIIKMVGKRLEVAGYNVVVAMDGQEAIEKLASERPDLVILDLMLPKLNGYSVCSTMKQDANFKSIPVIIFSAKALEKDVQQGMACGAEAYVCKPFKAQELLDQIQTLLNRPVPSSGGKSSEGFTLIELMLVIVIIAALASMVVPRLAGRSEEARIGTARADIKGNLSVALRLYEVDSGRYPSTEQGLNALRAKPTSPPMPTNWKGPYIEQEPKDPWGKPYMYRYPGTHPPYDYDLYSLGPDGAEGADDIVNWE